MHKPITTRKETSLCAVFCQQSIPWINIFIIWIIIRRPTGQRNARTAAWVVIGVTVITGARQTVKGKMASILTQCQSLVFIVVIVKPPVRAYPSVLPRVGGTRGALSKWCLFCC